MLLCRWRQIVVVWHVLYQYRLCCFCARLGFAWFGCFAFVKNHCYCANANVILFCLSPLLYVLWTGHHYGSIGRMNLLPYLDGLTSYVIQINFVHTIVVLIVQRFKCQNQRGDIQTIRRNIQPSKHINSSFSLVERTIRLVPCVWLQHRLNRRSTYR